MADPTDQSPLAAALDAAEADVARLRAENAKLADDFRQNPSDDARAALAEARARILAVAEPIDDPGYRTSFLESVPENRRTLALAREWLGEGG